MNQEPFIVSLQVDSEKISALLSSSASEWAHEAVREKSGPDAKYFDYDDYQNLIEALEERIVYGAFGTHRPEKLVIDWKDDKILWIHYSGERKEFFPYGYSEHQVKFVGLCTLNWFASSELLPEVDDIVEGYTAKEVMVAEKHQKEIRHAANDTELWVAIGKFVLGQRP